MNLFSKSILDEIKKVIVKIELLEDSEKIELINELRAMIHEFSPFKSEPVDFVRWIPEDLLQANDYNPNIVAPPEMKLLEHSIKEDGYTQPIVAWQINGKYEVIDGFHRNRVGKECKLINERIKGHLPISLINLERTEKGDRIASTIRHNRARGKHVIEGMVEIILDLKNRNWTDERIAKNLGMDQDEILRLSQIKGLASLFADKEFSKSWDIEQSEPDFTSVDEEIISNIENENFRVVNVNDPKRIFHTYDKWECYKAGFYATTKEGMTREQCEENYAKFLSDTEQFSSTLEKVITEWKYSCEHYLTNSSMNRIAWLGQAAMCYATGIPSTFRGGFNLLSEIQQQEANKTALVYLNKWLKTNGLEEVTIEEALSTNQMDLY